MDTPVSAKEVGDRIKEVRRALGSSRKELSYQGLADEIFERTRFEVSGQALGLYEKGERFAPVPVLDAIARVDPLKRGRVWLIFGPSEELRSGDSVESAPQGDPPALPMSVLKTPDDAHPPRAKKRRAL